MYRARVWCTHSLGRNEALEAFPVGRRLAFDEAKGRLWVVCRQCERWNLVPLEERGAVIEACARRYRDTRTRVSTDEIGLAVLPEGLDLVRIGRPLPDEFAAWRYGDQFLRRRRRAQLLGATGVAVAGATIAAGAGLATTFGIVALPALMGAVHVFTGSAVSAKYRRVGLVPTAAGGLTQLTVPMLAKLAVEREGSALRVRYPTLDSIFGADLVPRLDWVELDGARAADAVDRAISGANRRGATRDTIARAVSLAAETRSPHELLDAERRSLEGLPAPRRLALELLLHEADERRWLEGELADLERRWREAESLAGIVSALDRATSAG